jgi:hypothetical protein
MRIALIDDQSLLIAGELVIGLAVGVPLGFIFILVIIILVVIHIRGKWRKSQHYQNYRDDR